MEAAIAMYESYAQLAGFCTVAGKHRKGCNCKKLMCQKKYYECYQGCSHRGVMVQFVSDSRKLLVLEYARNHFVEG
ncbi:putative transcription factor Tesmin family [Helianthus annuus]|nr:putative transcription factor Tesmin family [Helianthus annuus]